MRARRPAGAWLAAVMLTATGLAGLDVAVGPSPARAAGPVNALPLPVPLLNVAPLATADVASTPTNTTLKVPAPGVLNNDIDPDGDSSKLQAVLRTGPAGALSLGLDGGYTYTPPKDFAGLDVFWYCAWDGQDCSLPAAVTITVTGSPIPSPTATPKASPTPTPTPAPTLPPLPSLSPTPTLPPLPSPTVTPVADVDPNDSPTPAPRSSFRPEDLGQGGPAPVGPGSNDGGSTGSDGRGGGSTGSVGGDDPSGADAPPPAVSVAAARHPHDVFGDGSGLGSALQLAAPAAFLAIPGLVVALVAILQAIGGIAWVPVVRKALHGEGDARRRRYRYIVRTSG